MKYCVSFFAVFLLGIVIDLACGPEPDPYDYYISFFHNNLQQKDDFQPFYFNGYTFLNGFNYEIEENKKNLEEETNAREWAQYLGKKAKVIDVKKAMYELSDTVESALYNKYLVFNKLPDSLRKNTFLKVLTKESKKSALRYYLFAEGLEHLLNVRLDRWDLKPVDSLTVDKKAKEAFNLAGKEKDSFLKLRYYYQTQRLLHYSGNSNAALKFHQNYIANINSKSHVIGWALCLKAGEEWKTGNKNEAAYLSSLIFAKYPERRIQAYNDYLHLKAPIAQVLKRCKNNREKAIVYAITGFHTPRIGLATLKKVYSVDPNSPMISLLLGREINKIEEGYLTPKMNGSNYYGDIGYYDHTKYDSVKASYIKYIPRLKAFCEQLASEGKYPEPELGNLASAYLSWIQKDTLAGFKALAEIKNEHLRPKLADEKQLINLLLLSQSITKMDTTAENKLLPSLTWLDKKVKEEKKIKLNNLQYWGSYDLKYYSASARDFYLKFLAPFYFKQKDTVKAALCILKSERTIYTKSQWDRLAIHGLGFDMPHFWQTEINSSHLEKILRLAKSTNKPQYLELLTSDFRTPILIKNEYEVPYKGGGYTYKADFSIGKNDIISNTYDLLGTTYLREHNYNAAVLAFKHINPNKLTLSTSDVFDDSLSKHYNYYPVVFAEKTKDYSGSYSKKKVKGYNKLNFAKQMANLQKLIKTDPKNAAKYYYKMANGLYNTSYYGVAWFYTAYHWADEDKYQKDRYYYDKDYLRERTTETWFLKAGQLSNNREFKAKCFFMAAKCRQKKTLIPGDAESRFSAYKLGFDYKASPVVKRYSRTIRENPYFNLLKNHYSKTKFYKTAVNECSYFRDFLASAEGHVKK